MWGEPGTAGEGPGWHRAEPCLLLLPTVPVGASLAPGHGHRPRAAPCCGDEMKHSGYRSEAGGRGWGIVWLPHVPRLLGRFIGQNARLFLFGFIIIH